MCTPQTTQMHMFSTFIYFDDIFVKQIGGGRKWLERTFNSKRLSILSGNLWLQILIFNFSPFASRLEAHEGSDIL